MKKKILLGIGLIGIFSTLTFGGINVNAHGFVKQPVSRVKNAVANGFNWNNIPFDQQAILNNPQGIEAPTELLDAGSLNGRLASAGLASYASLNEQSAIRWVKSDIYSGDNNFIWQHTARHKTNRYRYYMTKQGWNQNAPLSLDSMDLIGVIGKPIGQDYPLGEGPIPEEIEVHQVSVPKDRSGYHVVFSVWDINDTVMSFYQAIDVNVKSEASIPEDITPPSTPKNLKATDVKYNQVPLSWDQSTDEDSGIKEYRIFRDGKQIGTSFTASYTDIEVKEKTKYVYTVKAVDNKENISQASNSVSVETPKEEVIELDTMAPSIPTGVHSMGETTTTIDLMWNPSTDNVGVKGYTIYRDGVKIKTVSETRFLDSQLKADTTYEYTITAFDTAGNQSKHSNKFTVSTKNEEAGSLTTWNAKTIYLTNDKVTYEGIAYTAKWWNQNEKPSDSAAWEAKNGSVVTWNAAKAYNAGDLVYYNGKTYKALWWTKGENPEKSSVWSIQ